MLFIHNHAQIYSYFSCHLDAREYSNLHMAACRPHFSGARCGEIIRGLVEIGIFDEGGGLRLTGKIENAWKGENPATLKEAFCQKLEGDGLPLERFNIHAMGVVHVRGIFEGAADRPLHVPLYGAPGTGMTALARYLAESVNRECRIQRASDLLSAFVGETEQNIARAFAMAEALGAVLVINEVDSFLQNRAGAVRSWEVSQTNGFMAAFEACRGLCIRTTNLRKDMERPCGASASR